MEFENYENILESKDIGLIIAYELNKRGYSCNITKILKLMYFLYGLFLAREKKFLIKEKVRARPYGPVFPKARKEILKMYKDNDIIVGKEDIEKIKIDKKVQSYIDKVMNKLGDLNAGILIHITHIENSPWNKTKNTKGFKRNSQIPDIDIYDYFLKARND